VTPNLEKLRNAATPGPILYENGLLYALDGPTIGATWADPSEEANGRRLALLATHGWAMIEALETAQDIIHEEWCSDYVNASNERLYRHHPNCEGIVRLLATLEHDAKGRL